MKNAIWVAIIALLVICVGADPRSRAEVERELAFLNQVLEFQNSPWQAGITEVSLLSEADMQQMMGLIPGEVSRDEFVVNSDEWPARGNIVMVPNITEVKNQAQCGSCVAFGTTAAFEQTYWTKNNTKKLFSERYLFFCSPNAGYGCNNGWSLDGGAVAIKNSSKGIVESSECPYVNGAGYNYNCSSGCNSNAHKYTGSYSRVYASDFIKTMNSGRAVIIGMQVFDDFRYYKDGIYEHLNGNNLGGHCMVLVGYGTSNEGKNFWVIKNSWSTGWGKEGYLYLLVKTQQTYKDANIEDFGGYYFN